VTYLLHIKLPVHNTDSVDI